MVHIPFSPRRWQGEVLTNFRDPTFPKRNVLNIHRGGGKTFFCLGHLGLAGLNTYTANGMPAKFAYVGKSISHAKQTCWETLKFLLAECEKTIIDDQGTPLVQFNANDLTIKFNNNDNMIHLTGIEDPEKIRGLHVHGLILDEAQMCSEEVWEKVLAPTLRQNKAWALVIGTPNGPQGIFYKLATLGANRTNATKWNTITLTVEDTGEIDPEEWEDIVNTTDENAIQQEYYCSFEAALSNRVYHAFRATHRIHGNEPAAMAQSGNIDPTIKDRGGDLHVGMDFNHSHLPAIIAQQSGGVLEVFDEILLKNATTDQMAEALLTKYPGRRIYVYPDASGAQNTASQVMGSNHAILLRAGLSVITPKKNPFVSTRIEQVNVLLRNAAGKQRLFVHPRCKELVKTLSFQEINVHTGQPDKTKGLDHMGDALGYMVNMVMPITQNRFKRRGLR